MPPAVAVAAVTAAGALGGAALQSRGVSSAARRQQQAAQEATRLERERDAERRRRYDENLARYQAAWDQREATRRAILAQHGIFLPEPKPSAPVAAAAPTGPQRGPAMGPGGINTPNQVGVPYQGSTNQGVPAPAPASQGSANLSALMGTGAPSATPAPPPLASFSGTPAGTAPAGAPQRPGMSLGDLSGWSDWRNYGV